MMKKGYHRTKSGKIAKKGLWYNVNQRKKKGISRPKSKSTISAKAYRNMKAGFPNSKKNKAKRKAKKRRRR